MLDSGAATNLIDSALATRLGLTLRKLARPCYFQGAAGRSEVCTESTRAYSWIGRARPRLFFRVAPCRIPVILGIPFLARYEVRFDWAQKAASMRFADRELAIPVHFSDSTNLFSSAPQGTVVPQPPSVPLLPVASSLCSDTPDLDSLIPTTDFIQPAAPDSNARPGKKSRHRLNQHARFQEFTLAFIQPGTDASAVDPSPAVLASPESTPPEVTRMLALFQDVFPEKLPPGLPPSRAHEHFIEVLENSKPPSVAKNISNGQE